MTSYQSSGSPTIETPTRLGRYELLGKLATGGMGEIHLARLVGDGGFEKLVVVKRLLPELVASENFVAMFLDEARVAARLSHPNVCEVHELGRDGHEYYLAMPYLEGVPFADLIARPRESDRARELRLVCGLIAQACEGLHHAHQLRGSDGEPLGLVHRDVSPSNLFVTTAGVVKVLDFGIAKVRGATARTEVGTIKGKYAYMSPEQIRGDDDLDCRSDLFSLGIVLFELATHQRLFKRPSDFLAAKAILEEPLPRADAVDPAIPPALADVIARALSRDRASRFATARDLGAAVTAAGAPMSAADIAETIASDHAAELTAQRTRQRLVLGAFTAPTVALRRPRERVHGTASRERVHGTASRTRAAVLATLLLAAGAVSVFVWTRGSDTATDADTVAATVTDAGAGAAADAGAAAAAAAVPDAAADADAAVDPEPPRREPQPAAKVGWLSIDSTPYATIYVDGKRLGVTPLLRRALPAGKHRVRAVTERGVEQRFTVEIRPGKAAPPVNLTW